MRILYLGSALLALALTGCSNSPKLLTDGQLFCSKATADGPTVMAIADAASVGVSSALGQPEAGLIGVSVIGKTSATVAAICAAVDAVPVPAPVNAASAPVVPVAVPKA